MSRSSAIDVRQPEYTGQNRCWPCTLVNVALVALVALAAGVVTTASVPVAVGIGTVGLALVWLRGYVVPGTPRFAPRLVAPIPGSDALFHGGGSKPDVAPDGGPGAGPDGGSDSLDSHSRPDADSDADSDSESASSTVKGEELLTRLLETGVLSAENDSIGPTEAYTERWQAEMERLRDADTEVLAETARDISPATAARVIRDDDEWVALSSGNMTTIEETWLRRPVAIAEIAGYRATEPFLSDDAVRLAAARTNRMFLESCPDCGSKLGRGLDMECCGGYAGPGEEPTETLVCPSCEVRLYTFPNE